MENPHPLRAALLLCAIENTNEKERREASWVKVFLALFFFIPFFVSLASKRNSLLFERVSLLSQGF